MQVGDIDIKPIRNLRNLQILDLKRTQVTKQQIAELKKALPNVYISGP